MPRVNAPEEGYPVTTKEVSWTDEVIKSYGPKWNEPEVQYKFSNGRTIRMRTKEDIYDAASE